MTQCIRLLSDPNRVAQTLEPAHPIQDDFAIPRNDPFTSAALTYSTTGSDSFPAPAAYPSRRFSWIHIFPEGMIHQHPNKIMRYFKWGVARLILEAEPCPDVLPMWIDGPQHVMDNNRGWPKPLPRPGKDIKIVFGDLVDTEKVFAPFRQRWQDLKERAKQRRLQLVSKVSDQPIGHVSDELGVITDDDLKYGREAEQLRIEVTMAVRNEVLKVRRLCGLPDEDPKRGLAETFRSEGSGPREGLQEDGSILKDM